MGVRGMNVKTLRASSTRNAESSFPAEENGQKVSATNSREKILINALIHNSMPSNMWIDELPTDRSIATAADQNINLSANWIDRGPPIW